MFNIATTDPYIAQPATTLFRSGWDSYHLVPWILHHVLQPPRLTHLLLQLKFPKPLGSLSGSRTSSNRFRIFYRSPMPSTSNAMINTGCHISFRWETTCGCNCRNNTLQGPIESFTHSIMDLTPSPSLWVTMLLSSTFPLSLACT
jgi:hypothetical protein